MTAIVHLSDLHFGRDNADLAEPLIAAITDLSPDLVVVSGDLTQRARRHQFRRARAFLDRIGPPLLVVPGNHDVPLDHLFDRLVRPFARYRAAISADLEPVWDNHETAVVGVNSVNPLAWQSGVIRQATLRKVCARFDGPRAGRVRVVVLHHPLTLPPGETKRPVRGAEAAKARLAACGADLILCGHLHGWRAERIRDAETGAEALLVQAGTGLSTRLRGEENDFNLIEVDGASVTVTRHIARAGQGFAPLPPLRFRRQGSGWRPD